MNFSHLHVHTTYSLLDGAIKVEEMVNKLKSIGHKAVAVTEHGNMYSLVKVNKECREAGIKHIIGCEFYVAPISMSDKTSKKGESVYHHLIVLAKNRRGYEQLIKMCSLGFKEGFYYKPRIDEELLFGMDGNNIIVTTACIGSKFANLIFKEDIDGCKAVIEKYASRFGSDFYLEVQNHDLPQEKMVSDIYEYFSKHYGIPIIATQDSHYLNAEDAFAHDVALCIGTGQNLVDPRKFKFDGTNYHLLTTEEMSMIYKPEYLSNTQHIVDSCDDDIIEYGNIRLPKFQIPTDDNDFNAWLINQRNGAAI
jgi:DNA polymerase-3 subunit alpha